MKTGIVQRQNLLANQSVAASVALVDVVGFSVPVVAGGTYHFRVVLMFNLGAAGGFRFRLDIPAAPTTYINACIAMDGVTPPPGSLICDVQVAETDFTNALAVSGDHYASMEGELVSSVAGDMKLQFACNSAAGNIQLFRGSYFEVTTL